jgi:hypothetical protein
VKEEKEIFVKNSSVKTTSGWRGRRRRTAYKVIQGRREKRIV